MGPKKLSDEKIKGTRIRSKEADGLELIVDEFRQGSNSRVWWTVFSVICILAIVTRFYKVTEPDHVVWDETHFGKFGSWYINRTFFFDVHPPLGKCCTAMGASLVPFSFMTLWEMTHSLPAATFGAALILADGGFLTLTQYILLDPPLLFFIMASVATAARFNSYRDKPFSLGWWGWLLLTGVSLSGSVSVKFVGLFVVLYVGCHTIAQLWHIYGNLNNPMSLVLKHFVARALCLILLPIVLYLNWFNLLPQSLVLKHFVARALCLILLPIVLYLVYFYIHLSVLNKTGNGDGFYSSAFQSQLEGNPLHNASMPLELAYGAEITLKSQRNGGGYLHSHLHLYPEDKAYAHQQQITTYSHKDINNRWIVKKADSEPLDWDDEKEVPEIVRHGDLIRLEHVPTGRNLHSHALPAPVTTRHYQVTGYGENGQGDLNDVWRVEIMNGKTGDSVKTLVSVLKLVHSQVHCALHSSTKQLPKWAYEQMEVTCNPNLREADNTWNIEDNVYPKLPNSSFEIYAPSFLSKFLEAHTVMFQGNAGLKPKEGEVTSQPWQWPINYRMLIGAFGYMTGYDGAFDFIKPGDKYENVSYVGMRVVSSCLIFCALPFSLGWWGWLLLTGVSLSGSVSVKFVGLFVVLYVGCHTIAQLWHIYGNLNNPMSLVLKHFVARALCLILLPIVLYLVYFYIHLSVLNKT
ncbi:protein O-mannosyl-transferase 2, partial [Hyalella azteca]|uniref:Protein O-mannosyl-transferase 2 n=1 Tax=Hyalella azteca TaxID=294128 RepID=A0A979FVF7_HYAAZ